MKYEEITQLSPTELQARLHESQSLYYAMKDEVLSGKEGNYKKLSALKKDIARLQTALKSQPQSAE
ncbi:MAG: 50S ribosomal protein L29 [Candidatus Andersenbacteria bacterium]